MPLSPTTVCTADVLVCLLLFLVDPPIHRYTPSAQVQKARQAFASGDKDILMVTERFYFFKRWKLPGANNFLFFGPPLHARFYPELINSVPSIHAHLSMCLFTDLDAPDLERVVGSDKAHHMFTSSRDTFLLQ